ncbi:mycothione reductase [Friedmanniella luteola]|uniref:Mycothione reductase n=1 Tax=Friedmanniella luteola TaxID=546871 RepID=A0A1H1LUE1_9ACTN|nr:mycothione reductase [Friedmanniella luteola]SDR77942.1 mycothione reductase [Friedmanniella luteola]
MQHFDLVIIGSGSGNSIPDERFADLSIALVDKGVFGGTCLNVGCIPTKMFVHPADLAASPGHAARLGVDLELRAVHFAEIRDRIFGRIDPISEGGLKWRSSNENVIVFREPAHFLDPHTLRVGDETITADRFVLAAGSRPIIPDVPGLDSVRYHTSDTVMRLPELPRSMVIVGGGYIGAEFAHVFSSYGTRVTVVVRGDRMLRGEDAEVSERFTDLIRRRVDLRTGTAVTAVRPAGGGSGVTVSLDGPDGAAEVTADVLLVATGRAPNGDTLALDAAGVAVGEDGYVVVDAHQRTTAEHIWALGDVASPDQLKHVANHEARVVQHNLLHPDALVEADHRFVPHAVFSDPQVASVGLTEDRAREQGLDVVAVTQQYGDVAFGWAMEDTDHFVKLVADRRTGLLVGAHLIGPEASSLIQTLIQAMSFGQHPHAVARGQYWIHPALAEVVENALLKLPA